MIEFLYNKNIFQAESGRVQYLAKARVVSHKPSAIIPGQIDYLFEEWQDLESYTAFWLKFDRANGKFYG